MKKCDDCITGVTINDDIDCNMGYKFYNVSDNIKDFSEDLFKFCPICGYKLLNHNININNY